MANMMDYLDWRGDLTFSQSPFNEVDNLILAQLTYVNFDYIVPPSVSGESMTMEEASERYFAMYDEGTIANFGPLIGISARLFKKAGASRRFSNVRLSNFVNVVDLDQTKQFAAIHFLLEDGSLFITFRGTDNTIVGWKENFNMSFTTPVPSQYEAVRYLEETAGDTAMPLRLGGHSKGGNLAVYAAVQCSPSIQSRIIEVYNNDGPGFDERMTKSEAYRSMLSRVKKIVPQSSIVGMLLEHEEEYIVVQSNQKRFMQHDAMSWEVMGAQFVHVDNVTQESRMLNVALKSWLDRMDKAQREQFVDAMFYVFESTKLRSFHDLSQAKWKKVSEMIKALNQSPENKEVLTKTLGLLFREGTRVFWESWNPKPLSKKGPPQE